MPSRNHLAQLACAVCLALPVLLSSTGCGPAANNTVVTDLTPTTLTLSPSAVLINSGSTLTLTATVAPAAATGSITFFDGTTAIGIVQLSSGTAALQVSTLASGTHNLSAGYGGSSAYYASNTTAITVNVM